MLSEENTYSVKLRDLLFFSVEEVTEATTKIKREIWQRKIGKNDYISTFSFDFFCFIYNSDHTQSLCYIVICISKYLNLRKSKSTFFVVVVFLYFDFNQVAFFFFFSLVHFNTVILRLASHPSLLNLFDLAIT